MDTDPFDTAAIRERVLAGWTAAPVRFREDANAEEDQALGGYRDRLAVELAQNAADAASRAGVPGRLLLALRDEPGGAVLIAANVGAPLDGPGVEALATLRASAKQAEVGSGDVAAADVGQGGPPAVVGRFGVGFAAVLAVSQEPAVVSRTGGVRFSAADTRTLVLQEATSCAGLGVELARRDGHVPVLRLPFPAPGEPPDGYDTVVVLPLRDGGSRALASRLLAEVDDALLLALPGLEEIVVELPGQAVSSLREVGTRWRVRRRSGRLDPRLLADRPTEERARLSWTITWAMPRVGADRGGAGRALAVLHAPTPTDEPLGWAALLVAPFPLDVSRRHVAPGPATDALVVEAARAYADLLVECSLAGEPIWPLVPTGLPVGALDGALRAALGPVLGATALLRSAEDPQLLLRPADAVALDPPAGADAALVAAMAPHLAGLVHAPIGARAALSVLGVRRIALADLVEQLPPVADGALWRPLYDALLPLAVDPLVREALAAIPVPLADGRVARGARGLVLGTADPGLTTALSALGARAVDPSAVHPLLERLGAAALSPRAALELPEVRAAVAAGLDEERYDDPALDGEAAPDPVEAVLSIVAAAVAQGSLAAGDLPWLAGLALIDEDGELSPAGELALPGSPAARVLDRHSVGLVDAAVAQRWGPEALTAVGVLEGLGLLRVTEVALRSVPDDWPQAEPPAGADPRTLDGWQDWLDEVADQVGLPDGDGTVAEVVAVRDLDAVRDDAWPEVLAWLAGTPGPRSALVTPVRVLDDAGRSAGQAASYPAWWLRDRFAPNGPWADPDAEPAVVALLPAGAVELAGLDPGLRAGLGAARTLADLDPTAVGAVIERLADPDLRVDAAAALRVWTALGRLAVEDAARAGARIELTSAPARVRVLDGPRTVVVDADTAVVVDTPMLAQRSDLGPALVVADPQEAAALADLLDLPLASEVVAGLVTEDGTRAPVPAAVLVLLPDAPPTWCEHDTLLVDGIEVDWWVDGDGPQAMPHASTVAGLARALAWAAGQWQRRGSVQELLADPDRLGELLLDEAYAPGPPDRRRT